MYPECDSRPPPGLAATSPPPTHHHLLPYGCHLPVSELPTLRCTLRLGARVILGKQKSHPDSRSFTPSSGSSFYWSKRRYPRLSGPDSRPCGGPSSTPPPLLTWPNSGLPSASTLVCLPSPRYLRDLLPHPPGLAQMPALSEVSPDTVYKTPGLLLPTPVLPTPLPGWPCDVLYSL